MSLDEMTSSGGTVEIGGEKLTVNPRTLRHIGFFVAAVRKERGSSMELVRDALSIFSDNIAAASVVVEKAFEEARKWRRVTFSEAFEYASETWEGRCLAIWLAVRHNGPDKWTQDYVFECLSDEFEDRFRKESIESAEGWIQDIETAITRVSGDIDEMGNSTGSPPSTPEKVGQAETATM